jgi:phosphoribosyl 1,2-cyclic phosphate phosphodiesterase
MGHKTRTGKSEMIEGPHAAGRSSRLRLGGGRFRGSLAGMEVIVLGSGTSQGVPMIACTCPVCTSDDPRNRRTRCSIHVVMDGLHVQVDAAQEFREQCLRQRVDRLDLFILTHGHADHVAGMDDLRRFCDLVGGNALTVYSTDEGMSRVIAMYPYAIMERPVVRGYPAFKLAELPPVLELEQGTIRSTLLPHGGVNVLGLVFEERSSRAKFVYYTDCKQVPAEARALAAGADAVVLDGLRPEPHPTHLSTGEAVEVARALGAPITYLTHLTHAVDHGPFEATLPPGVKLAYDGLRLQL